MSGHSGADRVRPEGLSCVASEARQSRSKLAPACLRQGAGGMEFGASKRYGRFIMSENDIKEMARLIAAELAVYQSFCTLTEEEQEAVRGLIRTKRKAVKASLFLFGALILWILKDAYLWIVSHLAFK